MSRGINDLLSTSSDMTAARFSSAFCTDSLSVDRLHVDCHVVLSKHAVVLIGSLLIYISGKLEDVFVQELDGVVAACKLSIGLMRPSVSATCVGR